MHTVNARISLLIPLLLLSAVLGRAQEAAPDFSAGFKQLAALGLPALDAQAKWSAFPEAASTNYELRELVKSVKGNAWLLPSPDAKLRALALGGTEVIELKSAKKRPSDPDLTKDAGSLVAALKKLAAKRDPDDSFSYRSGGSNFGSLLLFATQLYQTGHPDLANQLALAVFELFPSREAALDSAIDLIAEPLYQKASAEFFSTGAWAVYHPSLADLGKRFPRGWASRDAVAIFLPQLEKQATGTRAPAPSLPDAAIDPRALEIIRELTDKPPADPQQPNTKDKNTRALPSEFESRLRMQMMGEYDGGQDGPSSLWLLDDSAAAAKPASPLARLMALKMAALPALAALAADPFLTHLPNARSYSGGYFSSSEGSEERTLRIYQSLKRPATRGEIATQLLAATLPDPQNELRQADPDSLRDLALTFWKEHQSATREELAAVFLREGNPSQASQAASILAASADPKAHQTFEAHVLAADPAIATFQDVRSYLRARKAAARSFFDAYAKLVRSQSRDSAGDDEEESSPNAWAVKEAGGAAKILKQLEALVGGQTPRALAVQIAKGKPADAAAAIKSLSSLLADATPTKHLHALLEGANAATDPIVRARFLTATFNIGWNQEEAGEEPAEDTPPVTRKFSEPEAAVWRKLLADTRELPKEFNCYGVNMSTVAALAATAFENSVSRSSDSFSHASAILNKPASAILMEQATARLAGKPIPPLPDASKVSAERLTEIVAAAGSKPSAEIHPYLSSLTPDERAAWFKWYIDPGDLAYPDSLKDLLFKIIARSSNETVYGPDVKHAGNLDAGFTITQESLTQYIGSLAPGIDQHSRTRISIEPAEFGPGLEIVAGRAPLPSQQAKRVESLDEPEENGPSILDLSERIFSPAIRALEANEAASAVTVVSLQGEDFRCQAVWLIQDGKATLQASSEQDDDAKDPFAASLKTLLESKERQHFQIEIQILTRSDAGKFKAASEDPASSEDSPTPTEEEEPP
jgi:hypothetical protein